MTEDARALNRINEARKGNGQRRNAGVRRPSSGVGSVRADVVLARGWTDVVPHEWTRPWKVLNAVFTGLIAEN